MEFPDPATMLLFGVNEAARSDKLNLIGLDLQFLIAPPAAHAYLDTLGGIAPGVWDDVTFNKVAYDNDNIVDLANGFIIQTAGIYQCSGYISMAGAISGPYPRAAAIVKTTAAGGVESYGFEWNPNVASSTNCALNPSGLVDCVPGDTITLKWYQGTATTLGTTPDPFSPAAHARLQIGRVGGL